MEVKFAGLLGPSRLLGVDVYARLCYRRQPEDRKIETAASPEFNSGGSYSRASINSMESGGMF